LFLFPENLTLSGKLKQFDDFLVAIITFCLFTQADLLRFLFNSIDADESGSVNEEEYLALLEMMTTGEGNSFPGSFKRMLEAVDVNKDGAIQFEEFHALAQRFPLALFQLFQFQIQVQAATLGQEGWMKVKRRVDLMLETAAMTAAVSPKKA
jgi:EF-hand domain pair